MAKTTKKNVTATVNAPTLADALALRDKIAQEMAKLQAQLEQEYSGMVLVALRAKNKVEENFAFKDKEGNIIGHGPMIKGSGKLADGTPVRFHTRWNRGEERPTYVVQTLSSSDETF
jgi:hypothetical protein